MKILQINNYHIKLGGAESVYLNTLDLLKQNGHVVNYLSSRDPNSASSDFSQYSINANKKSSGVLGLLKSFYSIEAANNLLRLIDKERPDIAHIHNIHGVITFSILPVLKKMNIPVIASIHDYKYLCPAYIFLNGKGEICEDCKGGKYYNCFTNNCSVEGKYKSLILSIDSYLRDFFIPFDKYIDQYIFVSKFTLDKFVEFIPQIKAKANQIYNFNSNNLDKVEISPNGFYLFLGRLEREKGLFTLLDAFKNFQDKKLVVVGAGSLTEKLKDQNLPNVEFLGYKKRNELQEIIKKASFVIVPSECYENNPMAIVESFSLGKPVIGSRLGGITELIDNNKNGFLFEAKDVTNLSRVLHDSSKLSVKEYEKLSNNAYQFALDNFQKDNYYQMLINIYQNSINSNVQHSI